VPPGLRKTFETSVNLILDSGLLGKSINTAEEDLESLFPLDPLAADILTRSLQRYGQNERSLFTFLDSKELKERVDQKDIFDVADCFDYLIQNLTSEIEDGEKNPFKPQWKAAVVALEKSEFLFESDFENVAKILKTICLVNIFSNSAGRLDEKVLIGYAENSLSVTNASEILGRLVSKGIIKYSNHRSKFNFIEGTDVAPRVESN